MFRRRSGSTTAAALAVLAVVVAACADENSAPDVTIDSLELAPPSSATEGTAPTAVGANYVVVAGDSLSAIADRHCVSTSDLVAANGWDDGSGHMIFPGDAVALPSGACDAASDPGRQTPMTTDELSLPADAASLTPGPPWAPFGFDYESGAWYQPYNPEFSDPFSYATPECTDAWHSLLRVYAIEPSDPAELPAALEALPDEVPADIMEKATRVARVYNEHKAEWARLEPRFYDHGDPGRTVEYREAWEPLEQAKRDFLVVQDYVWGVCPQNYEPPPDDPSAPPPTTIGPLVAPSASITPPAPPSTFAGPEPAST